LIHKNEKPSPIIRLRGLSIDNGYVSCESAGLFRATIVAGEIALACHFGSRFLFFPHFLISVSFRAFVVVSGYFFWIFRLVSPVIRLFLGFHKQMFEYA
jgi:hypothetical protein